ncbi:MAG: shikimate dehydrogenase [Sphingomonas sp.]|uniref:shikimate dehydrogenase family protein n=1 Tax=Sphingomonas sp. TaxID=28214 RepID=UPI0017EFEB7D|nr:shikimate dehydrogenase [Sphingomonas sp.]MBA3667359.1 shikimate dehydrogenase [Sphingomonas sp.]
MTARPYAEVIGDPIEHSLSPTIHSFWLDALKIDADYRRFRVDRAGLASYLSERRADPAWRGCNVTMPLKLDALQLADDASDQAVAAGAANLLTPREGKLAAANTDVGAIALLLAKLGDDGAAMGSVTVLGNGGGARAALVALKMVNLHAVRIQARDMAEAMKLAIEFGHEAEPVPLTEPIASDGLINATPLGMAGRQCLNCDVTRLPSKGWVFDLVTDPIETPLIAAARQRNLKIVTGREMLVEQAATSFKLLFDADPPRDRDDDLWQRLRP